MNILIYILAGIGAWFVISVIVLTIFAQIGRRVEEKTLYLVEDPEPPHEHPTDVRRRTNGS